VSFFVINLPEIAFTYSVFVFGYAMTTRRGVELFRELLVHIVLSLFRPFVFFFKVFNPVMQELARRKRCIFFQHVWNFALDCVLSASESLIRLTESIGV